MTINKSLEFTTLYEISKVLGSSLNINVTLKLAIKILTDYLDMKIAVIALIEDGELIIVASHGIDPEDVKAGRYKVGEGIMGKVAKTGCSMVIPDEVEETSFFNKNMKVNSTQKVAFLYVPIVFKKEILGVLSVARTYDSMQSTFDEDMRFLKIISSLVSQSVKLCHSVESEKKLLMEECDALKMALKRKYKLNNIVGRSGSMQEVFEAVHRVAPTKATVLLIGESGTGKELIARAIHYMGTRSDCPFVKFNCAAIPEGLLETELFGHEKGAFTGATSSRKGRFELAHEGTIFLDEIGDLTMSLQPKILRVLQEREFERIGGEKTIKVDVRVIAATSRNLEALVEESKFREDLYYRLNVVPIYLPPLRERQEDIVELTEFFLNKFNNEHGRSVTIAPKSISLMMKYYWPGNVRELENTIERLVIMCPDNVVKPHDLPTNMRNFNPTTMKNEPYTKTRPVTLEQTERQRIIEVLEANNWVHAKAAQVLGITARQIGYKVKKYGIRKGVS
ncbi:MAG: nif-specific transcriptional activator NifA [Candidatus Magnetoovum sp. WYHC-5]|nr:nif-specific transcriptional activator NifA [Candidatus Magnetoovum sp. WYHC-5]